MHQKRERLARRSQESRDPWIIHPARGITRSRSDAALRSRAAQLPKSLYRLTSSWGELRVPALTEEMKRLVDWQRLGFVATVCPDGTPNVSPKGTVCVLDDDHLVFADIRSPGTVANLQTNPNVEVNVVDQFVRKGYRFKGTAEVFNAGPDFEQLVAFFSDRGLFDAPQRIRAVVVIRVDQARPLISPGYDREGVDEATVREDMVRYYTSGDHDGAV